MDASLPFIPHDFPLCIDIAKRFFDRRRFRAFHKPDGFASAR